MNVKEFYETQQVFTEDILAEFDFIEDTKRDASILNDLMIRKYANCSILPLNTMEASTEAHFTLMQYETLFNGIYKAITTSFDPFITTFTETKNTGKNTIQTDGGAVTDVDGSNKVTDTPNITNIAQKRGFEDGTMQDTEINKTNGSNVTDGSNHTTTDTTNNSHTEGTNNNDTTVKGYSNIDYEKALESLYKTKEVNLYDKIITAVAKDIIVPIYEF